jgi:hypothetical protein
VLAIGDRGTIAGLLLQEGSQLVAGAIVFDSQELAETFGC